MAERNKKEKINQNIKRVVVRTGKTGIIKKKKGRLHVKGGPFLL
jgi:hypothetical protein